jgi:hypothetical protein
MAARTGIWMHDFIGIIVLATVENILCEAVFTVFGVRVRDKMNVNGDRIRSVFGLMTVVT